MLKLEERNRSKKLEKKRIKSKKGTTAHKKVCAFYILSYSLAMSVVIIVLSLL